MVIHQPSSDLFKMFDKILLLDEGGVRIYYGNPVESIIHFKKLDDQINSEMGECSCCGNTNQELIFNIVEKKEVDEYVGDISITPLAIPMITGPGAITNAIVMMEDAISINLKIILIIGLALVMLLTYLILLSSGRIMKILGDTGNKIMMRIMGLIVMIIAVEFFLSGFRPIFIDLMKEVLK